MIFTLLLWLVLGWFVGLLLFFTAGFMSMPLGAKWKFKAAHYYGKLAHKLLGDALIMERGTGYDIFSTSHDTDKNADKVDIDGNTGHVSNETKLKSTLYKRPFGLVPPPEENISVYVSPELGELGEIETERQEQDTLMQDGVYQEAVTLEPKRPMVRLGEFARAMIPESRSLWDLTETIELYKQSQSGFADTKTMQYMTLIIAYGVAALLGWLIATNAGGTAPTNIDMPSLMLLPGVLL